MWDREKALQPSVSRLAGLYIKVQPRIFLFPGTREEDMIYAAIPSERFVYE